MKIRKLSFVVAIVLVITLAVSAEHVGWLGDHHGGDGVSWDEPLNWWSQQGVSRVPTASDVTSIGWSSFGPATAVVGNGVTALTSEGWIADHTDGTLNIEAGGYYITSTMAYVGAGSGLNGVLNVNGGNVDITAGLGVMILGENGNGKLNINDGLVEIYSLQVARQFGSSGHIQLDGGLLDLVQGNGSGLILNQGVGHDATMDITGGEMRIDNGDVGSQHWVNLLTGYVNAGILTGYGVADLDHVIIEEFEDYTSVTAVPEPFSLGLLAIGAISALHIRK